MEKIDGVCDVCSNKLTQYCYDDNRIRTPDYVSGQRIQPITLDDKNDVPLSLQVFVEVIFRKNNINVFVVDLIVTTLTTIVCGRSGGSGSRYKPRTHTI